MPLIGLVSALNHHTLNVRFGRLRGRLLAKNGCFPGFSPTSAFGRMPDVPRNRRFWMCKIFRHHPGETPNVASWLETDLCDLAEDVCSRVNNGRS